MFYSDSLFRYQGQYEGWETGLYYRFRYYEPEVGSYFSQDPIRLIGNNPTLYRYVNNSNFWIDAFALNRRGGTKTQKENKSILDQFLKENPGASHIGGSVNSSGKNIPETYLPPNTKLASSRAGGSFSDLTFQMPDGTIVYVQTVDRGKVRGMSQREWDNANRIMRQDPDAIIITVRKRHNLAAGELDVKANYMQKGSIHRH